MNIRSTPTSSHRRKRSLSNLHFICLFPTPPPKSVENARPEETIRDGPDGSFSWACLMTAPWQPDGCKRRASARLREIWSFCGKFQQHAQFAATHFATAVAKCPHPPAPFDQSLPFHIKIYSIVKSYFDDTTRECLPLARSKAFCFPTNAVIN